MSSHASLCCSTCQSQEEPDCTDHDALLQAIDREVAKARLVIVEGFCLLHDERVRARFEDSPLVRS